MRHIDIYVHESGTRGSPVVVFFHGGGQSGRTWRKHMARLEGRFHCLAPDLPGFGRSSQLPPCSYVETADLMAELIRGRAPGGRAHVVGLSWGGRIAHTLLDYHPDRIDRAVIDGAGIRPSWLGNLVRLYVIAISPVLHTAPLVALVSDMVGMDEEARAALRTSSPRAIRLAYLEGRKTLAARTEITAASPTLLVAGEKESAVRRSNTALAAFMPHALARYVPGLAHAWLLKNPELHVRMLEACLADEAPPAELVAERGGGDRLSQ